MNSLLVALALGVAVSIGPAMAAPPGSQATVAELEQKPTGPISVDVRLGATPALGVPLTVTVTARAAGVERFEIELRPDDPAALLVVAKSAPEDRDGARVWAVTVVPTRASGGNLGVLVAGDIDGFPQAANVVFSIRPAGAAAAVQALSARPEGSGGENLSLLPVEERVRPPK